MAEGCPAVAGALASSGRVSSSVRRSARPNGTIEAPIRNAIRQPQASSTGALISDESDSPTIPATRTAASAVAKWIER